MFSIKKVFSLCIYQSSASKQIAQKMSSPLKSLCRFPSTVWSLYLLYSFCHPPHKLLDCTVPSHYYYIIYYWAHVPVPLIWFRSTISPLGCSYLRARDIYFLISVHLFYRPQCLISSVQLLSCVRLFETPWTAAFQASLSITNCRNLPKPMSIESMIPSNHLILLSPSPALNLSQHQGLFKWVSSSHQVAQVWEFQLQHQSFQWTPRTDLL